jgi:hypothetical protein
MSNFRHHKYTWSRPFESVSHRWELVGPMGALHLHVSLYKETEPSSCGLEYHHTLRAMQVPRFSYLAKDAPGHLNCPLTGGQCWHDGTSMYARETVWPRAEIYLRNGDHDGIFRMLEREYELHFERVDDADAA